MRIAYAQGTRPPNCFRTDLKPPSVLSRRKFPARSKARVSQLAGNADEGAVATPHNFDADAEQYEGRQPHQYIGAVLAERSDEPLRKSVAHIYGRCDRDETGDGRPAE